MPSSHLILCRPLFLPPILPSIRIFSSESTLHMRWPKYWSFSFSISPSKGHLAVAAAAKSRQSCPTLFDPMDGSPPGSRPWDSPGKNTGVGCHFLLQRMKVKSESEVAQSCPTLHDPMDCSLPGSSAHGIFQARVLEWVTSAFSCKSGQKLLLACSLECDSPQN